MTVTTGTGGSIRDRLIVALAKPEIAGKGGRAIATLVAHHEPMTVFEWVGAGKGLILLDNAGIPAGELGAGLDRVLGAHDKGLLFVAVAGGGSEVAEALREADARARNRDQLGLYHADGTGRVRRVAGRRLPELERAGRALPDTGPLSPEAMTGIAEHGRQERLDAMAFVRNTAYRFPHATMALIALCFVFFAITAGNDPRARQLFDLLCNDPAGLRRGEVWRLMTYALLHDPGNPTHLIVNMVSLYSLGGFLEPLLGRRRLVAFFAVTALAGGMASALATRAVSVGASGAVWGLLGATLGLLGQKQRVFPALIARSLRQRLVFLLLVNVAFSFLPTIDRYCHFGGFLAGYLMAVYTGRRLARRY